jgi:signal transduction histidine kinase
MLKTSWQRFRRADRRTCAALLVTGGLALVVIVGAWLAAGAVALRERAAVFDDARAELIGAQKILSAQAERTFEVAQTLLVATSRWLQDESARGSDRPLPELGALLADLQKGHGSQMNLRVIDASGYALALNDDGPPRVFVGDREFMTALRGAAPGTVHFGVPVLGRASGVPAIPVALAVPPNRYGVVIVAVTVGTAQFTNAWRDLLITAPAISGMVRADGTFLLISPDDAQMTGHRPGHLDFETFFADRPPQGIFQRMATLDAGERVSAYARLSNFPLAVFSSFRVADVAEKGRLRTLQSFAWAGLATVLTLSLAAWLSLLICQRERDALKMMRALAAAEQASTAKTDFLGRMSHELRTPLNAIIGFSEMIKGALLGPLPLNYQRYGNDIHASGRHLLGLIDRVLDVTMIESGMLKPKDEAISIAEVIGETATLAGAELREKDIELRVAVPEGLPVLMADRLMMRQMLLNLVVNAGRHCPAGTLVQVSARIDGDALELAVQDNGPGIPPAALAHVFEPFGRDSALLARKSGGVGLGLSITKSLVELHGGQIVIDTKERLGTRVALRFPANRLRVVVSGRAERAGA